MKRSQVLLAILAAVLLIALFYVLLFQPAREELDEVEAAIALQEQQQADLQMEITRLRAVRDEAPEVEAELAAAEAIVPRDAALPAALRQLQTAADEADIVLEAVITGRPEPLAPDAEAGGEGDGEGDGEVAGDGLSRITVSAELFGGYFQLVDFLRRVEDPSISPRGLTWEGLDVSRQDTYPELQVTVTGSLYALIATPPPPEPETPEGEETDGEDDAATDDGATDDGAPQDEQPDEPTDEAGEDVDGDVGGEDVT